MIYKAPQPVTKDAQAGEHSSPLRYIPIDFVGAIYDRPRAVGNRPYNGVRSTT